MVSQGKEAPLSELPPWTPEDCRTYPAVWRSSATGGAPSLQIHGCCVADLIIDGKHLGSLEKARQIVRDLMRPGIAPSRVLTHDWAPGDLVLFSNRSVWHSVVGTLRPDEARVFHQCNLAGTKPPEAWVAPA